MSVNKCNKCNKEVDIQGGGCAIMLAFCRKNSVNLINVSFCHDCYDIYIKDVLGVLNSTANLGLLFGDDGET